MAHFLKNAKPPVSEAVIALIDPDMILMSKLSPNVGEAWMGCCDLRFWFAADACVLEIFVFSLRDREGRAGEGGGNRFFGVFKRILFFVGGVGLPPPPPLPTPALNPFNPIPPARAPPPPHSPPLNPLHTPADLSPRNQGTHGECCGMRRKWQKARSG